MHKCDRYIEPTSKARQNYVDKGDLFSMSGPHADLYEVVSNQYGKVQLLPMNSLCKLKPAGDSSLIKLVWLPIGYYYHFDSEKERLAWLLKQ